MINILILIWLILLILKQMTKLLIRVIKAPSASDIMRENTIGHSSNFYNYNNSNFADTGLSEWDNTNFSNYSNSNFADTGLSEWESMAMWDD